MVAEVVVVAALVAKIASIIGVFEKIATIYAWLKKVASTKWKKELDKYIKYLRTVKKLTRRYKHSNRSETLITEALQLLDEELEESWSKVDKWMQKKKLRADDFIKELKSSRATIAEHLQVLWFAVQEASWTSYKERATNSKLDPAEKERLFRKHKKRLRKKYQQYWQLLNEVIKPELENKYLTSWRAAKSLLQRHQRFAQFPKGVRKREWRSHVEQISKKSHKTKRGTSGEKGKQQ